MQLKINGLTHLSLVTSKYFFAFLIYCLVFFFFLDVFETEPLLKTSPLWKMEKVHITPHISGISFSSDVSRIFAENYLRYISNESPQYLVDWDRGY